MSALGNIRDFFNDILSTSRNGVIATSYANDYVVRKKAYSIRQSLTIADTTTYYVLFDPSASQFDVYLEPFRISTSTGTVDMALTSDFTYTGATTSLPVINRYGVVVEENDLKNYTSITGLVINSTPVKYTIGSRASNQSAGGGVTAGNAIFVFEKDKKYLLSFKNNSGEQAIVSLQFDYFLD